MLDTGRNKPFTGVSAQQALEQTELLGKLPVRHQLKQPSVPGHGPIRVLIVDQHGVVRIGVKRMLDAAPDMEVVGLAGDSDEVLRCLEKFQPDVVVTDVSMGDALPAQWLQFLREAAPEVRIVVYTADTEPELALQAIDRGVQGYLLKSSPHPGLALAVRTASEDGTYIDPNISQNLVVYYRDRHDQGESPFGLTDAENRVLRLLAQGRKNGEIAATLYIAESTVKFHVSSILSKLGVENRIAAIRVARRWLDGDAGLERIEARLGLSARELEILELVGRGMKNREIAAALGKTERWVRIHMSSILSKLGAKNRREAVEAARQKALLRGSTPTVVPIGSYGRTRKS